MEKTAFDLGVQDAIEKRAEKKEKKQPGWVGRQAAAQRAYTGNVIGATVNPELLKKRLPAAAGGIAAGAAAGYGAHKALKGAKNKKGLAIAGGALLGQLASQHHFADKPYLKEKGIKSRFGGLDYKISDKSKKYVHKKYKGGQAED